jgi:hypothetical protein
VGVGGGAGFVERVVEAAGLDATVLAVDERSTAELTRAIDSAAHDGRPLILVAGGPPSLPKTPAEDHLQLLTADLRHPEHLRALLRALAAPPIGPAADEDKRARVDEELLSRVRSELDREISDHDAKRLLKAYGVRVTRQAPTNTPTGAAKVAKTIGLPVMLVASIGDDQRIAESLPDARRLATLMLQEMASAPDALPSVIVRERFPDAPRARAEVLVEKGLGATLKIGSTCALLPLTADDAAALAAATPARRAADQRAVAQLLKRIGECAEAEQVLFDLELFVGAEPCVLSAKGSQRR